MVLRSECPGSDWNHIHHQALGALARYSGKGPQTYFGREELIDGLVRSGISGRPSVAIGFYE